MNATAQDRTLSHPAARAALAVFEAARIAAGLCTPGEDGGSVAEDGEEINTLLEHVMDDVAAIYQDNEAKAAELAEQREEMCAMAQTIASLEADALAMERLDTHRVAVISSLKSRLAVASRDVEQLLQRASIRLQGETTDFNSIRGLRDVLDLSTVVEDHGDFTILDTRRTAAGAH